MPPDIDALFVNEKKNCNQVEIEPVFQMVMFKWRRNQSEGEK
jgi:hypothetical protein